MYPSWIDGKDSRGFFVCMKGRDEMNLGFGKKSHADFGKMGLSRGDFHR